MYSLHLTSTPGNVDLLSAELWEWGTVGIREEDRGDTVLLIAAFESNQHRAPLLVNFRNYAPAWVQEDATDWVQHTHNAWPPRAVGERFFLAPPWSTEPTPPGRMRLIHNPGLACGTGEHPCTQLALEALERCVAPGDRVADIGTGSGMLAIAARLLGASHVVGTDVDEAALAAARQNCLLNGSDVFLAAGSADALRTACADVVVANISGTVLLALLDDLNRITRPGGCLILAGFPEWEMGGVQAQWPGATVAHRNEWRCLTSFVPRCGP